MYSTEREAYYKKVLALYEKYIPKEDEEIEQIIEQCIIGKIKAVSGIEQIYIDTHSRIYYDLAGQAIGKFRH